MVAFLLQFVWFGFFVGLCFFSVSKSSRIKPTVHSVGNIKSLAAFSLLPPIRCLYTSVRFSEPYLEAEQLSFSQPLLICQILKLLNYLVIFLTLC